MAEVASVLQWSWLTPDEQRVLSSAISQELLREVHLFWIPPEISGDSNLARPYVEMLMAAAVRLVERKLVTIYRAEPNSADLSREEALLIVNDLQNWWRHDPNRRLAVPIFDAASKAVSTTIMNRGAWQ